MNTIRKIAYTIKGWLGNARFYFIITAVFIILSIICFTWRIWSSLSMQSPINPEIWGQFGDFVGGTLGVVFSLISVMLVVWTFKTQNETAETQRFNDLFFELLKVYQSEVKELNGEYERIIDIKKENTEKKSFKISKERIQYTDKDFFDEEKNIRQEKYRHLKSYEKNVNRALNFYMLFYTNNRSKMAAYFRTLYRIFELIDKSNKISEHQKKEYAKIVRAQLTDSELFFLRYNAMSMYGCQFIEYLNKYRVLKHLPAFELLEFKDWWKDMTDLEREGINIIFLEICEALKDVFTKGESNHQYRIRLFPRESTGRYQINLTLINKYDFQIETIIDKSNMDFTMEYRGLYTMDEKRIQQLMDCFIKEIFLFSNFNRYNNPNEIETYSTPIITKDDVVTINSGIRNTGRNPLIIKYPNLCPSTK